MHRLQDSRSRENSFKNTNLYIAKAGGRCAVSSTHRLHRFTLAAIWSTPKNPILLICNSVTGIPEVRRDPSVSTILQQTAALSVLDFVADFGSKLKIESQVIDT